MEGQAAKHFAKLGRALLSWKIPSTAQTNTESEKRFLISSIEFKFLVAFCRYRIFFVVAVPPLPSSWKRTCREMSSVRKRFNRERVPMGDLYTISRLPLLKVSRLFFYFLRFNNLSRLLRWQCAVISRKAGNSRHSILFCRRRFLSFFVSITQQPNHQYVLNRIRSFVLPVRSILQQTGRAGGGNKNDKK